MTEERRSAERLSETVNEWDGTPFRVDFIRNFPSPVTDEDLRDQMAPIGQLAKQIEDQLGYPIVEMGEIIDVPESAAPGWNENFEYYWHNDFDSKLLPRRPRQILVFYMNDYNPISWGENAGGSPLSAHVCCGTVSYNKRTMGAWWRNEDSDCSGRFAANGRYGHVVVHELFHILGFRHPDDPPDRGISMDECGSLYVPWEVGSTIHQASKRDIEMLGRIFPSEQGRPGHSRRRMK